MSGQGHWIIQNSDPLWLLMAFAVAALAVWSGFTSSKGRSLPVRALLLAVRLSAVAIALVLALMPARETDLVRAKRPPLPIVVDDSASMNLGPNPQGVEAARWLKENAGQLQRLGEVFRVEYFSLGPKALKEEEGAGLPKEGGWFARHETPLAASLQEVARLRPDAEALVVLSDGRDTENPGRAPQLSVPVFPLASDAAPPPDLWLETVEAPPVGFIRTPVEVRLTVGSVGMGEGQAEVTLLEDGLPIQSAAVRYGAKGGEGTLTFTPQRTGKKAYRLELSPKQGEASRENNSAQFTINVIRDKTRVLLLAGTPTWDVKAVRRRLAQDPGIDLITFMILRTPSDTNTVESSEMSLIPFPTDELFNKELHSFDAVVMANFDYGPYVPLSYLTNLKKFVSEAGGGFVMLGGDRSFGLGGYENSPLAEVLPVDLSGSVTGKLLNPMPFRPRLTDEGNTHPVMRATENPAKLQGLYQGLPELQGLNWVLKARTGAHTLLEAPQFKNEFGPAPVIVAGDYGKGRTLAIATDSLWRWSMPHMAAGGEESFYRDFWTRSLRWLVHDPDMELVRLSPPRETMRAGTAAVFGARVMDFDYRPAKGAKLTGELYLEGGQPIPLSWREEKPGEYLSLPVTLPKKGLVKVNVTAHSANLFLGRDEAGFTVEPQSPEPLRIGVDREYLGKLAKLSQGKVYGYDDPELFKVLMERGKARQEVVGKEVVQPWKSWWVLGLLIALMALDWGLRRLLE